MPKLTRNPVGNEASNTGTPTSSVEAQAWQFYEQTYTGTGAQEWIFLPDGMLPIGVVLSGSGPWVATIEATDSPPDVVLAGNAVAYAWPNGTQTATTSNSTLIGATAVRANITNAGTGVKVSVRA